MKKFVRLMCVLASLVMVSASARAGVFPGPVATTEQQISYVSEVLNSILAKEGMVLLPNSLQISASASDILTIFEDISGLVESKAVRFKVVINKNGRIAQGLAYLGLYNCVQGRCSELTPYVSASENPTVVKRRNPLTKTEIGMAMFAGQAFFVTSAPLTDVSQLRLKILAP